MQKLSFVLGTFFNFFLKTFPVAGGLLRAVLISVVILFIVIIFLTGGGCVCVSVHCMLLNRKMCASCYEALTVIQYVGCVCMYAFVCLTSLCLISLLLEVFLWIPIVLSLFRCFFFKSYFLQLVFKY